MDIFEIKTEDLLKFRDPSFYEFCKECKQFGKRWSCPPVDLSVDELLPRDTSYVAIEYAHSDDVRKVLHKNIEAKLTYEYEIVFSAGHCNKCDVCLREKGEICRNFHYSAEVLCLDMIRIFKFFTGIKLKLDDYNMIFIMQGKR